jgi:hypothetical protein
MHQQFAVLFSEQFARRVYEGLVVSTFTDLCHLGDSFSSGVGDKAYSSCSLILMLAQLFKQLETSTSVYVLDLCVEQFRYESLALAL